MRMRNDATGAAALTCGVLLFYLAFLPPHIYSIDGISMLQVAVSAVTKGSFEVSPSVVAARGPDGRYYSMCWPLLSVVSMGPVEAAHRIGSLLHRDPVELAESIVIFFSPVFLAITAGLVASVALRLKAPPTAAIIAGGCFAFGTIAMVYARDFFAEPLLTLLTMWGLYAQLGPSDSGVAAGMAAGLGVLAKPPAVVMGPLFAAHGAIVRRRARAIVLPILGTAAGLSLYGLYNLLRFGSLTTFGQPYHFALRNIPVGAAGLLVSPGRGVIWYSPAALALLGLRRRVFESADVCLALAIAAGYFAIYSMWDAWQGGWCWGPRTLLPALALLMAVGALLEGKRLRILIALAAAGFVINAPTLVSSYFNIFREQAAAGVDPYTLVWSFTKMPLVEVWRTAAEELAHAPALAAAAAPIQPAALPIVEGVWWWRLPQAGLPPCAGIALSTAMTALALLCIVTAFRKARMEERTAPSLYGIRRADGVERSGPQRSIRRAG